MRTFNLARPNDDRIRPGALNRCCRCRYEWPDQPFGHARHPACPGCGSVYWKWLNYGRSD